MRDLLRAVELLFLLGVLGGGYWLAGPIGTKDARVFRTGATLCGPHMYEGQLQLALQPGVKRFLPYYRAPFYGCLLRPLKWIGFDRAWLALNLAAVIGVALLIPLVVGKRVSPAILGLFFPFAFNFAIEQDGAVQMFILLAALRLWQLHWPLVAGAVLAFTLQKPTLYLLVPLVLLVKRERRMLAGYAGAGLFLILISLWILDWRIWKIVGDYQGLIRLDRPELPGMPTARGLATHLGWSPAYPILALLTILSTIKVVRELGLLEAFSFGLLASVFLSPQSFQYDLAVAALPLVVFAGSPNTLVRRTSLILLSTPPLVMLQLLPGHWSALNPIVLGTCLLLVGFGLLSYQRRPQLAPNAS